MRSLVWDVGRGLPRGRRTIRISALLVAIGLCFGLVLVFGQPAGTQAASAPVSTQASNTVCSQSALQAALTAGQSTITFAPGCTIELTSSLTIGPGVNITINGNGVVLDGQTSKFDIFDINDMSSPSTLTLSRVTTDNGLGGINDQASRATVHLTSSVVHGSQGEYSIHADTVTASSSTISDSNGDGIRASNVTVTNSTISRNAYGIDVDNQATVTRSTISGNEVGIGGSTTTVTGSTISGNYDDGIQASNVSVTDSTISGNRHSIGSHNGISGIVGNGIEASTAATVTATILASSGLDCAVTSLTDGGYNLSTDNSCQFSATGSKNNVSSGALYLLPLANNGGPTQTIALGPGSVAIDAIPVVNGKCAVGTQTDQRGVSRPQGSGCDIGAYEATINTPNNVYFPETGHFLSNGFLAYWQHFGGLAVFGYPISDEFQQNGVTVQYFERARFEWHPGSDPARYDVELGLLGDQAAVTARQQTPAPFAPITAQDDANCTFYAVTGHRLCFGFRAFWQSHGGLAIFGYPISEEFTQNGLTVQYFERAVFEYHPNNPVAYQVELRLLGDEQFGPQP